MLEELYHKINGPFKRDMDVKPSPLIMGEWAVPEFEYLKDSIWVGHEKIDGTNIRIKFKDGIVRFGGRTVKADIPVHLMTFLNETISASPMNAAFPDLDGEQVTLYGEGSGHKIQSGGKYHGNGNVDFVLFDVKIGDWWLTDEAVDDIAKQLNMLRAPEVFRGTLKEAFAMIQNGFKSTYGDFYAEGIVAKPKLQLFDRGGRRIITKIKHRDFFRKDISNT